jgi:hypothetical protein
MKRHFLIAISLTAVLPAVAARIETSATCRAEDVRNQSTTSCGAHYEPPPEPDYSAVAGAGATGHVEFPVKRAGYDFGAWAGTEAFAYAYSSSVDRPLSASVGVTASLTALFTTQGPVREGWIDLSITGFGDGSGAAWSVGPYRGSVFNQVNGRFPFTLGQPFEVWLGSGTDKQVFGNFSASGSSRVDVFFRLWETDLSNRVPLTEVVIPEPVGTGAAGALILLFVRLLRQKAIESLRSPVRRCRSQSPR